MSYCYNCGGTGVTSGGFPCSCGSGGQFGNPDTARQAQNLHDASQELGQNLGRLIVRFVRFVFALFLHPKLCFLGFWLAGVALIMTATVALEQFGVWDAPLDEPPWWLLTTFFIAPVVLTVVLKRYVPRIMKGLLVAVGVMLAIGVVVSIADHFLAG